MSSNIYSVNPMTPPSPSNLLHDLDAFRAVRVTAASAQGELPPHLRHEPLSMVLGDAQLEEETDPNVADACIGYKARIEALFDQRAHEVLRDLREPADLAGGETREARIQTVLQEFLSTNFDLFWGLLESAVRMNVEVKLEAPLEYLDFFEELSIGFIKAYQAHPDREGLKQKIAARAAKHPAKTADKSFRGASTPKPFPLFQEFAEASGRIPDGHAAFRALYDALQELSETATSGKQRAQPMESCQVGWEALLNALKDVHSPLRVHTSTQEYLGMIKDPKDFHVVEGRSEDELIASLNRALEEDKEAGRTPVILLGSVRRTGERVDVNRIHKTLKAAHPSLIFVIDGAQDHFMYPDADAALYSKRLGATGTGLMFLSKDRFNDGFYERFNLRHGVHIGTIATTLAALRCERRERHFANPLSDLRSTPSLWEFVGGGNYIEYESEKVVERVNNDPHLSPHFTACHSPEVADADNPTLWRASRNIALRLKEGSTLSLRELTTELKNQGYYMDWISIKEVADFQALLDLSTQPYSEAHCREFFDAILRFQNGPYVTYVTEMLSLPEVFNGTAAHDEETYRRQVEYMQAAAGRQNMIRLLIDITKSHDAVQTCLSALSETTRSLSPTA